MALKESQLVLLNTIIYADCFQEGGGTSQQADAMETAGTTVAKTFEVQSVSDVINEIERRNCDIPGFTTKEEWEQIVKTVRADSDLMNYKITNMIETDSGMRAACFVDDAENPKDINVVFRGTATEEEWKDNIKGAFVDDSKSQEEAKKYIERLPESYGNSITVSGHSKGGNRAQYATITTDRISRCVSLDGQGFSEGFIKTYQKEIQERSGKITSISASYDVVNRLLYPIAPEENRIYVEVPEQDEFFHYHKPNILVDAEGNLGKETTEGNALGEWFTHYSTHLVSYIHEPLQSKVVESAPDIILLILNKEEFSLETLGKHGDDVLILLHAVVSNLDDYVNDVLKEVTEIMIKEYGLYSVAIVYPLLFLNDLENLAEEYMDFAIAVMMTCAEIVMTELMKLGEEAKEFAEAFIAEITLFSNNLKKGFQKLFSSRSRGSSTSTYIKADTALLRVYADRLKKINQRIEEVDEMLDSLYWKTEITDLLKLISADSLTGESYRLKECIKYLNDTAQEFEKVENSIRV